jgi:hypothetical protein
MAALPRVAIGQRATKMGLWVSKPGKNVLTASDDDMLVSPTNPNLAFLLKGQVNLTKANQQVAVLFGTTLRRAPIVWAQVIKNGLTLIPALQYDSGLKAAAGAGPRFEITPTTTGLTAKNLKGVAYTLQYMVLHYPLS